MSSVYAAWQRQDFAPNYELPTNPAERDAYIMRVIGILYRGATDELTTNLLAWQATTGFERDKCRYDVRPAIARYRRFALARNALVSAHYADLRARQSRGERHEGDGR